jgi:hypothetical protein
MNPIAMILLLLLSFFSLRLLFRWLRRLAQTAFSILGLIFVIYLAFLMITRY